jgi:hypothetical protein
MYFCFITLLDQDGNLLATSQIICPTAGVNGSINRVWRKPQIRREAQVPRLDEEMISPTLSDHTILLAQTKLTTIMG